MLEEILLFLLAILPIIVLGIYVYRKDKHKEPKKLLLKLFLGGFLSAFITVLATDVLKVMIHINTEIDNYNSIGLFLYTFIVVSSIEELSKWIIVYLFSYNHKEFDELYDMIVYAVFVSLGFAFIENILYAYDYGVTTAIIRIFTAVPIHVSLGIFMGYFLSMAKLTHINNNTKLSKKNIILSIIVPILLHGIYDYCLSLVNPIIIFVLLVFVIALYVKAYKKLKNVSNKNSNLKVNYCLKCGNKLSEDELYCTECGNRIYR